MTSSGSFNLQRFIDAQQGVYEIALSELRAGSKQSHWMWFIFPQLTGLGRSPIAKFYGLASAAEADAYLGDSQLGPRLRECVDALLSWGANRDADQIFGEIDAIKLRSSMTLFDRVEAAGLFEQALLNFFDGERDPLTLALLGGQQ